MEATRGIQLQLLGSVRLCVGGQPVNVGVRMQRFVLAVLALEANRLVTTDRLIGLTWSDRPPATARRIIQTQISRLRATFAGVGVGGLRLRSEPTGYLLDGDRHGIDVHRFTELLARAAAGDDATRLAVLDEALGLWRGPALAGTTDESTRASLTNHLEDARWTAMEDRLDALLRLGRYEEVITDASRLAADHPYRPRFTAQRMLALHRAGRSVDALATYRQTRQQLVDDFGLDPPAELRRLERAIIRDEPQRETDPAGPAPPPVPRQLPAPPQAFTGRGQELSALEQVHDPTSTVVIAGIDGMAGVGKTALAVQAAHQVADRYPDGQLFIDLHGYTHGVEPIEPGEALDHLLSALGVPGAQIPAGLDERAALYRTRLADRRMLIVLDNAAEEAQVAPLLPGAPGCLVLVTSRRRLAGLDRTRTLSLDTLPAPDALTLFVQTAGADRLADQPPEQTTELIELCGRLPLAIRIAAARLRSHPSWKLSELVDRLRDQRHRLGELAAGQRSVLAALDLSYQHLSAGLQHAYRRLGLHPGSEFDRYAAAALLEATPPRAGELLDQLLEAHLVQEPKPGRYRFHDLIRAHAAAAAGPSTAAVLEPLLDYYRRAAAAATAAAYPYEQVPPVRTTGPELPDLASPLEWLDIELPNLLAAARYATDHGRTAHVSHLSTVLHPHLRARGRYHDAEALHQQALATAYADGNQAGQLAALIGLGEIHRLQGRHDAAGDHYREALRLARAAGHRPAELNAVNGLGEIHRLQGRYAPAGDHYREALRLARAVGHRPAELDALNGLGHIHLWQGRYREAGDHYRQALQVARATGHRPAELNALNGLGHIHRRQRRYGPAGDHYRQALQLARATGNRTGELVGLNGLGQVHRRQRRYAQAGDHYEQLLHLAQESGNRSWQFEAWQGLGRLRHAAGHPDEAVAHHEKALALAGELSQPDDQARAHDGLAHAHHALHDYQQARTHWQRALAILTDLGVEDTEDEEATTDAIRGHLAALVTEG